MATSLQSESIPQAVRDQILATIYGQCIGDAIGLLTEFMDKREAKVYYGKKPTDLKYEQKVPDFHRGRWEVGDWTDDTDQMILILQSLLYNKGKVDQVDFAKRMKFWMHRGFPELGDFGGMGIGNTTSKVLDHMEFTNDPEKVAKWFWESTGCKIAANGSVMRTSILGVHQWQDLEAVRKNSLDICKTTHYDPRCQASVVAVTTCIALMLQHTQRSVDDPKTKKLDVDHLIKQSYNAACQVLETPEQKEELWKFMSCTKIKKLDLSERDKIGYTYKCMGSGFWALKQSDFKKAIIKLVMEGGDADTNGSVAGALLGCKLGVSSIPTHWISGLKHKDVMDNLYQRFITLQSEMSRPLEERSDCDDMSVENIRKRGNEIRKEKERQMEEERRRKNEEVEIENEKAKKMEEERKMKNEEQEKEEDEKKMNEEKCRENGEQEKRTTEEK